RSPMQQAGQTAAQPPVRDIFVKVTATRLRLGGGTTAQTTVTQKERQTFTNQTSGSGNTLLQGPGNAGVASDSAGQQHVRGEHAEIAFVVDGVPLPDTLSGRQGSVVVPATVDRLNIITGGFAPEFGGQTAAILDITTLPGSRHSHSDLTLQGGSYDTTNGDFSAVGPLGANANFVVDIGGTRSLNYVEPQQPDDQTAHNAGSDQNYFAKFRYTPSHKDVLTLTLSQAPGTLQLNNRTGLPSSYADVGQGFGFLGLRDANGVRPDATPATAGLLGAQPMMLASQQADGMDIDQREVNEFAIASWRRQLSRTDTGLLSVTLLHSGQDLNNANPAVDVTNLPVDNSIEYSPTVTRNVHQVQATGSITSHRGAHELKTGFLEDEQSGNESYQITPDSQLALDELAALDGKLAPPGAVQTAGGKPVMDVDGNPVYKASGQQAPLNVHRQGFYRAAYVQDTWTESRRFAVNYGARVDWFGQTQNLGQAPVNTAELSPRFNFSYILNHLTTLRWSYNRLFNTPPLAQGAVVGEAIRPETLSQYDLSLERQLGR
ncbi:MAG TPA: TonB-dependent receptor, partial [Chloroflexota bacterium]|nr:TonB-dependent receptor [Chloroflexota bacterium]